MVDKIRINELDPIVEIDIAPDMNLGVDLPAQSFRISALQLSTYFGATMPFDSSVFVATFPAKPIPATFQNAVDFSYTDALSKSNGGIVDKQVTFNAVTIALDQIKTITPAAPDDAANKAYVDTKVASVPLSDYLKLIGGTVTGQIKGIPPVSPEDLTRKDYVQSNFLPLAGGTVNGQIKGISPIDDADLTRKDFVELQITNIDYPVDSVFGRSGTVVQVAGDYSAAQISFSNALTPSWSATDAQLALEQAYADIEFLAGSITLRGVYDADTNVPDIIAATKLSGNYWIVSVEGSTVLPLYPSAPAFVLPYEVNDRILWIDDGVDSGFAQLRADTSDFLLKTGGTMLGDITLSNALSVNGVTANSDASNWGKDGVSAAIADADLIDFSGYAVTNAATLNIPINDGGVLISAFANINSATQTFINYIGSMSFFRTKVGGVWGAWSEIFASDTRTSAEANTILDNVDGNFVDLTSDQIIDGEKQFSDIKATNSIVKNVFDNTALPIVDCNLANESGAYRADELTLNAPTGVAGGVIFVAKGDNTNNVSQIYGVRSSTNTTFYIRSGSGGSYSVWSQVFASDTRTSAEANTILDNADAGNIGKGAPSAFVGDMNSLTYSGFYNVDAGAIGNPVAAAGVLVVSSRSAASTGQLFTSVGFGSVYTRVQSNGAWSAWLELATVAAVTAMVQPIIDDNIDIRNKLALAGIAGF